jgi:hypothetical protein
MVSRTPLADSRASWFMAHQFNDPTSLTTATAFRLTLATSPFFDSSQYRGNRRSDKSSSDSRRSTQVVSRRSAISSSVGGRTEFRLRASLLPGLDFLAELMDGFFRRKMVLSLSKAAHFAEYRGRFRPCDCQRLVAVRSERTNAALLEDVERVSELPGLEIFPPCR